MKRNSDNFRESSIQDVMRKLAVHEIRIIIYEPMLAVKNYSGYEVVDNLENFAKDSDLIIANRLDAEIQAYVEKVYTRDLYMKN